MFGVGNRTMQVRDGSCRIDQAGLPEIQQCHFMRDKQLECSAISRRGRIAQSAIVLDMALKSVCHVIYQRGPIEPVRPVPTPGLGLRYLDRSRKCRQQWRDDPCGRHLKGFERREGIVATL